MTRIKKINGRDVTKFVTNMLNATSTSSGTETVVTLIEPGTINEGVKPNGWNYSSGILTCNFSAIQSPNGGGLATIRLYYGTSSVAGGATAFSGTLLGTYTTGALHTSVNFQRKIYMQSLALDPGPPLRSIRQSICLDPTTSSHTDVGNSTLAYTQVDLPVSTSTNRPTFLFITSQTSPGRLGARPTITPIHFYAKYQNLRQDWALSSLNDSWASSLNSESYATTVVNNEIIKWDANVLGPLTGTTSTTIKKWITLSDGVNCIAKDGDLIEVETVLVRDLRPGLGNVSCRLYLSSSTSSVAGSLIANATMSSADNYLSVLRRFHVQSITGAGSGVEAGTEGVLGSLSSNTTDYLGEAIGNNYAVSWLTNKYLLFTITLSNASDSAGFGMVRLEKKGSS